MVNDELTGTSIFCENSRYKINELNHSIQREYTLFYKNIFYKNIEAEICDILRIF